MQLLVIDDSPDDRILYSRLLHASREFTYKIREASSGSDGIKQTQAEIPDCILLDYSMPGQHGVEILKKIRADFPFVAIIMLTGQGNEKIAVDALHNGAQNYIAKSDITLDSLEHVIQSAIEYCSLQKCIHEQRTSLEIFARALAHDLKEPVRTIRSFLEIIKIEESLSDSGKNYLDFILNAADRMNMLINSVFFFTQLDARRNIAKEEHNIADLLEHAKNNLSLLISEHNTIITHTTLPSITVSNIQIIELLQNLISNAISHNARPITIEVDATEHPQHWELRVSDNGEGIEERYLQKIFEPFKRLSKIENHGSGLGLAICKKIVEHHGGKIWCESELNNKTTFFFTLPKSATDHDVNYNSDSQEDNNTLEKPNTFSASTQTPHLANVLLVDDNLADIKIAQKVLLKKQNLNCHLSIAYNGEQALELIQKCADQDPIDLLLLDINMPIMDGFEMLEQLRQNEKVKHLKTIIMTGSTHEDDIKKARTLGAAGYLVKPIEFEKLCSVIETLPNLLLKEESDGNSLYTQTG